jgi:predicted DNA repair protein MutK
MSSLLVLLDDIATLLDDVSVMTKIAAKKTAGVLGDDLALNAQQVTGVAAERELPVVWAVAKGSVINKAILVPAALAISAVAPWAVTPLLMIGGAFLCYEGFEKVAHRFLHSRAVDVVAVEKEKIKGAVRTDFILSAEIITISLGTVAKEDIVTQLGVLVGIALIMTIGVYGLVAAIVKLDDLGLHLTRRASSAAQAVGKAILRTAPWLMKGLSIAGTAAMFLVGGGILAHGIPPLHHAVDHWAETAHAFGPLVTFLANFGIGLVAGGLVLAGVTLAKRLFGRRKAAAQTHS